MKDYHYDTGHPDDCFAVFWHVFLDLAGEEKCHQKYMDQYGEAGQIVQINVNRINQDWKQLNL